MPKASVSCYLLLDIRPNERIFIILKKKTQFQINQFKQSKEKDLNQVNTAAKMNLSLFSVIAFLVFVNDTNGQFGPFSFFGPPAGVPNGWMIGQEASKNAVNTAVNGALAKADTKEFPPEIEVTALNSFTFWYFIF